MIPILSQLFIRQTHGNEELLIENECLLFRSDDQNFEIEYRELETSALVYLTGNKERLTLLREIKGEHRSKGFFESSQSGYLTVEIPGSQLVFDTVLKEVVLSDKQVTFNYELYSANELISSIKIDIKQQEVSK